MTFYYVLIGIYKSLGCFLLAGSAVWVVADYFVGVGSPRRIKGLKCMDNFGYPIVGSAFNVLNNPSLKYMNWARKHNCKIFQVRLGNKVVVVVNSFEDCKKLYRQFSTSTNSRPMQYVFHNIVSETQGFTIGSTPWSKTYRSKKKQISMNLNKTNVQQYSLVIDLMSTIAISHILKENVDMRCLPTCKCPNCLSPARFPDVNLMSYVQLFVLKTAINLSYGIDIDAFGSDRSFCNEIIKVESKIIRLRSPASNLEDSIPLLRWKPFLYFNKSKSALTCRGRRDKYMDKLLEQLFHRTDGGDETAINSIVGKLSSLSGSATLTSSEIKSICLTLISAGLDNTPLNFNHLMGHLSQECNVKLQRCAIENITHMYNGDMTLAWKKVPYELKCDYVVALVQETFRYFTVLPLSLPRQTTKDIFYNGVMIPRNTTIFFNTYAANNDPIVFENPTEFNPDRWLLPNVYPPRIDNSIQHFSFGDGSRKCPGNHLAIKEIYTLTCRILILFKIKSPTHTMDIMQLDPFGNNSNPRATSFEPKDFKVKLQKRYMRDATQLYKDILNTSSF